MKENVNEQKKRIKDTGSLKALLQEEDGAGVVEVVLILVVIIGLVIIFKKQITDLVNSIFSTIRKQAGEV